jgi:putative SOS response-associated peptidase YedK
MCGRFTLKTPVADWLRSLFPDGKWGVPKLPLQSMLDRFSSDMLTARYNIAPSQQILVVRQDATGVLHLDSMRWGLIPAWASDTKIGYSMINARAETLAEKPSFRPSLVDKRCIVLADGYYEWQQISAKEKQPHWIHQPDEGLFAMAGLWAENFKVTSLDETPLRSTTIVTTAANSDTVQVHDRMPAIWNDPEPIQQWLSIDCKDPAEGLLALLRPCPQGMLQLRAVGKEVGAVKNDSVSLIQ